MILSRTLVFLLFLVVCTSANAPAFTETTPASQLVHHARSLFYRSIDNEDLIASAEKTFRDLQQLDNRYEGRAVTYLGALTALKGKHAFWPHEKWRLANEGIEQMDRGIALSPNDIEALFIHGSTCYYLPFFFNRAEDAQRKFKRILRLLPSQLHEYDTALLQNVLDFLKQHAEFEAREQEQLQSLQQQLAASREKKKQ
jgi:hypothetical protein